MVHGWRQDLDAAVFPETRRLSAVAVILQPSSLKESFSFNDLPEKKAKNVPTPFLLIVSACLLPDA